MLPELIVGTLVIFMVIGIVVLIPGIAVSYIEFAGILGTDKAVQFLRITFFIWFIMCILTGSSVMCTSMCLKHFIQLRIFFCDTFRRSRLLYDRPLLSVHVFNRRWIKFGPWYKFRSQHESTSNFCLVKSFDFTSQFSRKFDNFRCNFKSGENMMNFRFFNNFFFESK